MKTIEFVTNPKDTLNPSSLRDVGAKRFDDQVLVPELKERKLRFDNGANWFRVLPAIKPTAFSWLALVHVVNYEGGRIVHPRTFDPSSPSVLGDAYQWLRDNAPESLYSKANRDGVRLLADPLAVCWVLCEHEGEFTAKLLCSSAYDGSRGGTAGLGFQIWQAATEYDENKEIIADAIDPEAGLKYCVERKQAPGAKFPSYGLKLGRQPAPLAPMIEALAAEERAALCPLEQAINRPTEEQQWQFLRKIVPEEYFNRIEAALKKSRRTAA